MEVILRAVVFNRSPDPFVDYVGTRRRFNCKILDIAMSEHDVLFTESDNNAACTDVINEKIEIIESGRNVRP